MIRIHTWLVAAMLLMVSQRAAAADFYAGEVWGPYIENFTKSIDITGNLHYSFDLLYYDHEKEGYFWGASTRLCVDDTELFFFKDLLDGWYQPHKRYPEAGYTISDFHAKCEGKNYLLTKKYSIPGTLVYVSVRDERHDQPGHNFGCDHWITIDLTFERNYTDKQWTIKWVGHWFDAYNKNKYEEVDKVLFTTTKPTVTMPTIEKDLQSSSSPFSRSSNNKIKFTLPTTNYSGWSTMAMMYKQDCTNEYKDPTKAKYSYGRLTSTGEFSVSDNYTPVTVYPRFELYKDTKPSPASDCDVTKTIRFDKDYGAITIPGLPRPKANSFNVKSFNSFSKEITLEWEREAYDNTTHSDGEWVLFRKVKGADESTQEEIAKIADNRNQTKFSLTDKKHDQVYGTQYTYSVCYRPKGWTIDYADDGTAYGLYQWKRYKFARSFSISNEKAKDGDGDITYSWSNTSIQDASASHPYTLHVQRSDNGGSQWEDLTTMKITSPETTSGSYTDKASTNHELVAHRKYKYRVKVDNVEEIDAISSGAEATLTNGNKITNLTVSRGDYSNSVVLTWEVKLVSSNESTFSIYRRPLGSTSDAEWSNVLGTVKGNATRYTWTDNTAQAGCYYEYRVNISEDYEGNTYEGTPMTSDGFCRASGLVSGQITYDSGTAVEGAKITLKPNETQKEDLYNNYALYFNGSSGQGMKCETADNELKNIFKEDFTIQMWLNPHQEDMDSTLQNIVFDYSYFLKICLTKEVKDNQTYYLVHPIVNDTDYKNDDDLIPAEEWSHLTFAYDATAKKLHRYTIQYGDSIKRHGEISVNANINNKNIDSNKNAFVIGNSIGRNDKARFGGCIDEFRIFNKCLTETDILRNYCHMLSGTEDGLQVYYPFDEGLAAQNVAYDFSKRSGVNNDRHARANVPSKGQPYIVPSDEQLSLMTYTDAKGNYILSGIPFWGDGVSYTITPTLGVHQFNPRVETRFFSMSSQNYSGVDFEDVSSFKVSGTVRYANTDYPVEGCMVYVDGTPSSKDGEMITTNSNGEFTVSVPIGDHFVQIKKDGHVFASAGRYPADTDSEGLRHTFDRDISGLEFVDETLVNFTGRVIGGSIQADSIVGFQKTTNNIGVAEMVLSPQNELYRMNVVKHVTATTSSLDTNDEVLPVLSDTTSIQSHSFRGATADFCRKFYIYTDSLTGEFSALLPPLEYKIESIKLKKSGLVVGQPSTVDLSNPRVENYDTLYLDADKTSWELYKYHTKLNTVYHSEPTFTVKQTDRTDGAFGISTYKVKDVLGEFDVDVISTDSQGEVTYNYGYPLFQMGDFYEFWLDGYEEYVNEDGSTALIDRVPLKDVVVTIDNELSAEQEVYGAEHPEAGSIAKLESNQLQLDEKGQGTIRWRAGLPNITYPYTRNINIYYEIDGRNYDWKGNPMEGILLGYSPTGNNFVTAGPDNLDMILRDPPGSQSFATWEKGSITSSIIMEGGTWTDDNNLLFTKACGVKTETGTGVGAFVISEIEAASEFLIGVHAETKGWDANTVGRTVTATKAISTSDSPEYDGADADIFIGCGTNIIFGDSRLLHLSRDPNDATRAVIKLDNAIDANLSFSTNFAYTRHYIEHDLLPNLLKLRNSCLTYTNDIDNYVLPAGANMPVYVTDKLPDNPEFGSQDTYRMVSPDNFTGQDTIQYFNNQIAAWEKYLSLNEEAKVKAFENRTELEKDKHAKNYSFDAGSTITDTYKDETIEGTKLEYEMSVRLQIGGGHGFKASGAGWMWEFKNDLGGGYKRIKEHSTNEVTTFSYTLKDNDVKDAISVDVYNVDAFGPIFRTRAGQTSNPYEGEVKTKYYEPGTTIMEATMQVDVPKISVENPMVNNIPAGSAANYTLGLANQSQIGEELYYLLMVPEETNPHGAQITVDGMSLSSGNRKIKVPYGETLYKSMQLKQSDISILDYDRIAIVLASVNQYDPTDNMDVIADTVWVSAHFVPSSSSVNLAMSNNLMNTQTGSKLTLTFSDFDRNYKNLKAFRLQYRKQGSTDWTLLHQYVLNKADSTANSSMLPESANISYDLDMDQYTDGEYLFRVVSVATYGASEVYRYSDELPLTKDMQRPQLIAQPSPSSGILTSSSDLTLTFNEDILKGMLTKPQNFHVEGVMNESRVAHDVALSVSGSAATAKTEATMDLKKKPFSMSMWLNYTSDGTLLRHGVEGNGFTLGIEGGKLAVNVGTKKVTSDKLLPTGKWMYLNVSLDTLTKTVSAGYALDAGTEILLDRKSIGSYEGNGPIFLGGNGLTAKMQEVAIWNTARSMAEAQGDMYTTKSQYTNGLLGYWQLNEGRGEVAADRARSRNLTLAGQNAWWIDGDNYALVLDGNSTAAVDIGALNTTGSEDYLVEAWFRADKTQAGVASVLSTQKMDLRLDAKGRMEIELVSAQDTTVANVTNEDLRDDQWHHVAVNVLKSTNGGGVVYLDGQQRKLIAATAMPELYGAKMMLGNHRIMDPAALGIFSNERLKGAIDEVRIWKGRRTADVIKKKMFERVKADEPGLAAYYPMERLALDEYNQVVTTANISDVVKNQSSVAFYSDYGDEITAPAASKDNTAALKMAPSAENVQFEFVASDRQITVLLTEQPYKIEGCNIYVTAREVSDLNGNLSQPITWGVYVQQNNLKWQDDAINVSKQGGNEQTFTATIENKGSETEVWSLSGLPTWLTASTEAGTLQPLGKQTLTFTVAAGLPIGSYETTVFLTGMQNINDPLFVNVTSEGDVPDWVAKTGKNTMTVLAQLKIDGVLSSDPKDMLAAFRGTECVGVASPMYFSRYDSYFVLMNIYGTDYDNKLTYKAYDASTGMVYPCVTPSDELANEFVPDRTVGTSDNPVIMTPQDKIEQIIAVDRYAWKWFSLYAQPESNTPDNVFADAIYNQAVNTIVGREQTWTPRANSLSSFQYDQMYKVYANRAFSQPITGATINPDTVDIKLSKGWNWIGYPVQASNSLSAAFADADPQEGDQVKSQSGFSLYTGGDWIGTLTALVPGEGYMYQSTDSKDKTFHYPTPAMTNRRGAVASTSDVLKLTTQNNMTMIAVVMDGEQLVDDAQVSVFAGSELRGRSTAAVLDGKHFLTIGGNSQAEMLTFEVTTADGTNHQLAGNGLFNANAQLGSMQHPYVLQLNDIIDVNTLAVKHVMLYDGSGRLVRSGDKPYTKADLKALMPGVYYQHIIYTNGQSRVEKLLRLE